MGNYTQYFLITYRVIRASLVAQTVKKSACNAGDLIWPLSREDPLEKWMATHFSIFAWRIPWTEEPVRLQFTGLQRVGHDFYIYKYMCLPNNYHIYSSLWPPEKKNSLLRHQTSAYSELPSTLFFALAFPTTHSPSLQSHLGPIVSLSGCQNSIQFKALLKSPILNSLSHPKSALGPYCGGCGATVSSQILFSHHISSLHSPRRAGRKERDIGDDLT